MTECESICSPNLFDTLDDHCFEIATVDGVTTILRAPSVRERQVWVESITQAIRRVQKEKTT